MTRFAVPFLAFIALFAAAGTGVAARSSARAAVPYTVSVSPAKDTVPVGELAVFNVKVQGQTTALPSFVFNVEGGAVAGVGSIDPTAANIAEGTVFVSRDSEGTAKLTVSFAGEVLAAGQAKFARIGKVDVRVSLDAGPDAAARTWRYDVVTPSGEVAATLQANTSGDFPTDTVSAELPYGLYTIRQVLGNDTRTACSSGIFYRVATPSSAETTIELASSVATVDFAIAPCPDLPTDLGVTIPIDTLVPAAGVVGDADVLPGETPVSEVRGTRQEGPGNSPLPPSVGNSVASTSASSNLFLLLLVTGAAVSLLPVAAWSAATVRARDKR